MGVQEIAAAAGVTKPSLYHHFGSKVGLFEALLSRYARPHVGRLAEVAHYDHDLTGTLNRLTRYYLEFAQGQPHVYRLLAACALAAPESEAYRIARPYGDEVLRVLEGLFESASQDHGNMQGRSRQYAHSFLGVLDGYARLVLTGEIGLDGALEHAIVTHFSYGIYS